MHASSIRRNRLGALLVKAGESPGPALAAANRILAAVGVGHESLLIAMIEGRIARGASLDPADVAEEAQHELQRQRNRNNK